MDIVEKLLERINEYNEKMKSEKNMSAKMSYLEEIIRVGQITRDLHFIVHNSILNVSKEVK